MNTHLAGMPNNQAVFKLIVLEGPEKGKKIDLAPGRKYIVGRGEDCDIRIDAADKTVSRKHAALEASIRQVTIENLSAANPVLLKGKPIQKAALKDTGQFRIGATLYAVKKSGAPEAAAEKAGGKSTPSLRLVLIAVLAIMGLFFAFIILSGDDPPPVTETGMDMMTRPVSDELPPPGTATFETRREPKGPGLSVSAADRQKADEHFRKGMFFYDTGNIARAVAEWNRAVVLNPDHPDAQTWFLRAEKELAETVKTHYQNAMLHYKYMRYDDAAHEFRLVIELSRDKTSDQYINALKLLNEIQGR
jgi:tetratricopeptide (TPR) repeat protein